MLNELDGFQFACPAASVAEGEMRAVELSDRVVIIARQGGRFYCLDDVCTHDGGTLSDGEFCEGRVTCPRHGAQFDVRTGEALTMPATEDTVVHDVMEDSGNLYVRIRQE
jgi:3-phenylpropionate/trans-cinnamate dioxygenase ferredoxin subunit